MPVELYIIETRGTTVYINSLNIIILKTKTRVSMYTDDFYLVFLPFLSCEHLEQYHFPLGLEVSPTHWKWNHSMGHWEGEGVGEGLHV